MKTEAQKIAERVPLPEPEIEGYVTHPKHKICYLAPLHYTAAQMEALRLAVAAEALRGAEAVAWRITWSPSLPGRPEITDDRKRVEDVRALDAPPIIEPLYTAPPAGSVEVTDARVERLARHMLGSMYPNSPKSEIDAGFRGAYRDAWLKKARAALTAVPQEP